MKANPYSPAQTVTPVGEAAMSLDLELSELYRIATRLEAVPLKTDKDMDRVRALLLEFSDCRNRIGIQMQSLGQALDDAQKRIERCTQGVTEQANSLQAFQGRAEEMLERFKSLGDRAHALNSSMQQFRDPSSRLAVLGDSRTGREELRELTERITILLDDIRKLQEDAHSSQMRILEKNVAGLRKALQAALNRLRLSVNQQCESA